MSDQNQDQNQVKSDIIVVAKEGYSVLLEIDGRMLDIDCHESVNLSEIFSVDILEKCSSLSTHLKDGNLIILKEDTELFVDTTAVKIEPLREETALHITSQYTQAEKDVNRTNIELETRANITENTCKHIQERVQASKEAILKTDQKILTKKTAQTTDDIDKTPVIRKNSMTPKELALTVTMDISASEFADKQIKNKAALDAGAVADETRAQNEIDNQNTE